MAVMLVRPWADAVVKPNAPLPHEIGDIFEVRPDGCNVGGLEGGWAIDRSPIPKRGEWPIWFVHVPGLPASRTDIMLSQERYDTPEWSRRDASESAIQTPAEAWVRGCWLDVDALELRHRLSLQQTGHCWLSLAEAQAVFHTMTDAADSDLSRF